MADEERINDGQPDPAAGEPTDEAGVTPPEPVDDLVEPEGAGAENAPDPAPDDRPQTAAEQLASDALAAAQSAIAGLDEDIASGDGAPRPPASAPSRSGANGSAPGSSNGSTNGSSHASRFGPGSGSAPAPFTPEQLVKLASIEGGEGIDILSDVELNVKIELGRTRMLVEDVLRLTDGAVVELDKLAGDPVDIYVNDRHVARGEVLILNDNFCVRVSEILAATIEER
jgi:flagellar motor switch protein FliN/FliY